MKYNIKTISWIVGILAINNIVAFTPNFGAIYYLVCSIALFILILKSGINNLKANIFMIFIYIACIISICFNNIPTFFQPWSRFLSFLIMTSLLSPFLSSEVLNAFKCKLFYIIQYLSLFVVLLSLVFYFLGISYSRQYFSGITTQSMLLGPISANAILFSMYNFFCTNSKKTKVCYIFMVIISFTVLLLASSRIALVGTIFSLFILLYRIYKHRFFEFFKKIISIVFLLLLSFPYWQPYTEGIVNKNKGGEEAGSLTNSRDIHWQTRIEEFKSSPMIGIGFASVSLNSNFDYRTGQVETGSSWLNILSMTGFLGFICHILLFFYILQKIFRLKNVNMSAYLLSLLFFWVVHMLAEGYIFAAGGFMFFSIWLFMGYINSIKD